MKMAEQVRKTDEHRVTSRTRTSIDTVKGSLSTHGARSKGYVRKASTTTIDVRNAQVRAMIVNDATAKTENPLEQGNTSAEKMKTENDTHINETMGKKLSREKVAMKV